MISPRMFRVFITLILSATALHAQLGTKPTVDFNRQIKPIFSKHCYDCHNDKKDKGGFAFDKVERLGMNIGRGRIIVPGSIEDSDIIDVVQGSNGKKKMPPEDKGELSAKEIELMRTWIKEGAIVPGLKRDPSITAAPKASGPKMLDWTNLEGKTIKASFEGREKTVKEDVVLLKMENGKVFRYPMNQLNTAGQSQAKVLELRQ